MCDSPELLSSIRDLKEQLASKDPTYLDICVSDTTQPWIVSYRGYRHIFMWLPSALTLVCDDYGTGAVQAQVWINVGFRPGTRVTTSGQSSPALIRLKFSDEVVP